METFVSSRKTYFLWKKIVEFYENFTFLDKWENSSSAGGMEIVRDPIKLGRIFGILYWIIGERCFEN